MTGILTYGKPGALGRTPVDLDKLIASRLLIQASSGGGKSRAIRQLLEETHGRVQHIVIDPEGEFASLREKFDYVLAAKAGGDVEANPRTAKLLCRKLMEMKASAILDLYELKLPERQLFVRNFLNEMLALPRSLWHPVLVVIDETQQFMPERGSGDAVSTEECIALAVTGRKRGFCMAAATSRISKVHKDGVAELLNKMIGRTGDVDVKRAGDELGFGKEQRVELKTLVPGEFYVYGPAISNTVTKVRTGDVKTTHPEAGAIGVVAPAAPAKIRALLAQLAELPQEAEHEARSLAELRQENTTLKAKLTRAEKAGVERIVEKPVIDERAIARAVASAVTHKDRELTGVLRGMDGLSSKLVDLVTLVDKIRNGFHVADSAEQQRPRIDAGDARPASVRAAPVAKPNLQRGAAAPSLNGTGSLPKGERIVLVAIASYPDGVDRDQLSVLTGYKRSSRDTYVQRAQARGHVNVDGARITITDDGVAALGDDYAPMPTGDALREHWLAKLPEGERRILRVVLDAHPHPVERFSIDAATGYKRSSRDTYLQRLGARRLITFVGGHVRASDTLFS